MLVNIGGDNAWKEAPLKQICDQLRISVVHWGTNCDGTFLELYMPVMPTNEVERRNKQHVISESLAGYL